METKKQLTVIKRRQPAKCLHTKEDGSPCKAIARRDTGFCNIHSGFVPANEGKIDLEEGGAEGVRKFLAAVARDLRKGKIKSHEANALANVCDKILKCNEYLELEEKSQLVNNGTVKREELLKLLPTEWDQIDAE
jgi:hypothetical protein